MFNEISILNLIIIMCTYSERKNRHIDILKQFMVFRFPLYDILYTGLMMAHLLS